MADSTKKQTDIKRHNVQAMGINPVGLDYCRVEEIIARIGPQLKAPHRHDYYEIIWFTECSGYHMVEFVKYELRANTLFFFPRNQIHSFLTTKNIKGHMLRFDESFFKRLPERDVAAIEYSLFRLLSSPVRYLTEDKISIFTTLITLIKDEIYKLNQQHHLAMLLVLLKAFLIESERISPEHDSFTGKDESNLQLFQQFTDLLENNFHKQYGVQQYADMMRITPKKMRSFCKQISGLPAKKIIQERLILEAKLYLQHTDMDIQEISSKLGFEDPAYFSRFFKKVTLIAPSMFRQKKA